MMALYQMVSKAMGFKYEVMYLIASSWFIFSLFYFNFNY